MVESNSQKLTRLHKELDEVGKELDKVLYWYKFAIGGMCLGIVG